jgi:serine/threonine protein kinase
MPYSAASRRSSLRLAPLFARAAPRVAEGEPTDDPTVAPPPRLRVARYDPATHEIPSAWGNRADATLPPLVPVKRVPMDTLLALPNGTELAGDYRIERVLGAGGFGITYLAEEVSLARAVAIKEYFPSDFASREGTTFVRSKSRSLDEDYQWGLERFIEEAQALARFDHSNIVKVYRYFRANNTGYMVLQHEPGDSFKGWLDNLGRAPEQEELDRILMPLLEALESIHERDFLHRDIAPDNIIIRPDGGPVLIDFGSARREVARHARTVSVLVKPGYSPFEQYAETGKRQGPWTDIYALAATLYHGVTGRRPSDAPSRMNHDDVAPAAAITYGNFRPSFLDSIDHGLALAVEDRPQSIAQWRAELLGEVPVPEWVRTAGLPLDTDAFRSGPAPTRKLEEGEEPLPAWHGRQQAAERAAEAARAPKLRAEANPLAPPPRAMTSPTPPAARAPSRQTPATPAAAVSRQASAQAPARPAPSRQASVQRAPAQARAATRERSAQAEAARAAMAQRMGVEPLAVAISAQAQAVPRRGLMDLLAGVGANMRAALPSRGRKARGDVQAERLVVEAKRAAASADIGALAPPSRADAPREVKTQLLRRGKASRWWLRLIGPVARLAVIIGLVTAMVLSVNALRREPSTVSSGTGTTKPLPLASITDFSLARALRGHGAMVTGVAFAADGKTLASVGADGMVQVWEAATGARVRSIVGAPDTTSLDITDGLVTAGSADGTVKLWRLDTGDVVRSIEAKSGAVRAVVFGSTSNQVFAGGQDGKIRSFDQRGNPRGVVGEHAQPVLALAYAAGPRLLVSSGADGQVKLWDERRRKLIRSYTGHVEDVQAVAISSDGKVLASGSDDRTVSVWDAGSSRKITDLAGHTGRVVALAFSPRAQLLASASEDGTVKLWDWTNGKLLHTYEGHIRPVRALAFPPDGHLLASAGDDDAIRLWNVSVSGYP